MSRMLSIATIVAVSVFALSTSSKLDAQNNSRQIQTQKRERPIGQSLRIHKVSPRLEKFLIDWYNATKKVQTIEGITYKFEYDSVFGVEKRGKGTFYYGAPDKGRLDIDPVKILKNMKGRIVANNVPYTLQGAEAKKWVSTGMNILEVDVAKKTGQRFKIPPENRGENIMHGPLPFLLGMPPDVIKSRYQLSIDSESATLIRLKAIPNWRHDRANYRMARIILNKKTFMPSAVQMFDPTGNLETVYSFKDVRVNKKRYFWQKDPISGFPLKSIIITDMIPKVGSQLRNVGKNNLKPGRVVVPANKITGTKNLQFKKNPNIKPVNRAIKLTVPNVIGLMHSEAKKRIRKAGFDIVMKKGSLARTKDLAWRVESQFPKPRSVSYQGNKIELTLYVKASDLKPATRTANKTRK